MSAGEVRPGDTVACPLCGRSQVVFVKRGELAIHCDHGEAPSSKPVALSRRGLVTLGAAMLLTLVALVAVGSCVRRAWPAPSCPPIVCPLESKVCPSGCACLPRAPGDSVGVCAPCPA